MGIFSGAAAWLGLIIPAIIVMYLLKRRRRDQPVSSTLLWEQVLRDMAANVPWQKLRRNLLLYLQLAVAACLVFAAMRPYVAGATGGETFLLIDTSASMMATDVRPTRLAAAQAEARQIVAGLGPRDAVTVIDLGPLPRVVIAGSRSRSDIGAAIDGLRAGYGSAAIEPALNLATSLAAGKRDVSLIVLSDGGVVRPTSAVNVSLPLEFRRIGGPTANVAVAALAARTVGGRTLGLARLVNYGSAPADYALSLTVDGRPFDVQRGQLPAGEGRELVWELPQEARILEARLAGGDALAADDAAWAVLGARSETRVLLVSSGNIFLERALSLSPGVSVTNLAPDAADLTPSGFDIYVYDGALPATLPAAPTLIVGPPSGGAGAGPEIVPGTLLPARQGEGLLAFVDLSEVAIAKTRTLTVPSWGRTVLESSATPLIYAGDRAGQPTVVIGFDLHQSNLPLRPAFPILVQNIIGWLTPGGQAGELNIAAGQPFAVYPSPQTTAVSVTTPTGRAIDVAPPFPVAPFAATNEVGLYTVRERTGGQDLVSYFAVNLESGLESALTGAERLPVTVATGAAAADHRQGTRELWPILAWLALIILAAEWWVHNRGL